MVFMQRFLWVPGEPRDFQTYQCSDLKKQSWHRQVMIRGCSSSNLGSDGRINCFGNRVKVRAWSSSVTHRRWWRNSVGIQILKVFPPSVPRETDHSLVLKGRERGGWPSTPLAVFTSDCSLSLKTGVWLRSWRRTLQVTGQPTLFSFF